MLFNSEVVNHSHSHETTLHLSSIVYYVSHGYLNALLQGRVHEASGIHSTM